MKEKRIVITGIGVVSSIAVGKDDFWKGLLAGKNGIKTITVSDLSDVDSHFSYEIPDLDYEKYMGQKPSSCVDRATRFLLVATKLAIKDGKLEEIIKNRHSEVGVVTGTQYGCLHSNFEFHRTTLLKGPAFVNPMRFPGTIINYSSSMVSMFFKADALNTTVSSGTAAGADAVGYACKMIEDDRAKIVLTSGLADVDLEDFFIIYSQKHRGFRLLPNCPDGKTPVVRPFDKSADGLVMGEGATVLILEELKHAKKRGAQVLAEVLGYSSAYDSENNKRTLEKAMRSAIEDAGKKPEDIDYICASANGWLPGDQKELQAINEVFKDRKKDLAISSIKSMVGELCGGSGPTQVAAACFSIRDSDIPPTLNFQNLPENTGATGVITGKKQSKKIDLAMINSFGYDGNNACLVIGRTD